MARRSMVLLMVLLAAVFLTPNSALAAKTGMSYRAKVFASDDITGNSVSATFKCSGGSLSGSFFYQLASGASIYGDIKTPATCPSLSQPPDGNGTWSTSLGDITANVFVESSQGLGSTGTLDLQFQFAPNGHTFTSINTTCTDSSVANPCVKLMLTWVTNPCPAPISITDCNFSEGTSATLLLSVRG